MTREFFDRQMTRLSVLRFPPADIDEHFEALRDIQADVFDAAVSHALKTRRDFPVPAELRADADHVAVSMRQVVVDEVREVPLVEPFTVTVPEVGTVISITREWKYYDERCHDSGWAAWWGGDVSAPGWKPWYEASRCDRRQDHGPHEWVGHCACYDSNPALVRKREAQRKYAASPQKVS